MPPMKLRRRRSSNGSSHPPGRATLSGKRGDVEHNGGQVPLRRPRRHFRGGGAAVLASATEAEDGNAPPWCPDNEHTSEVLFDVIS